MIGFPHETETDVMETINYAAKSKFDDVAVNIVMAYPGTRIFKETSHDKSEEVPEFMNRVAEKDGSLASSKMSKYSSMPKKSLTPYVTIERLMELKEQAYDMFYGGKK